MRFLILLTFCMFVAGCETPAKVDVSQPADMPTYQELVASHNDRVKGIDRFWARTVIEIRWVDDKGRNRFEQGDGNLILDLPKRSALTIGKVGITKLWAGSDDTYFWLFDELDVKKLYIGRHDDKVDPALGPAKQRSPLPVRPVDLPRLLGISKIGAGGGEDAALRTQAVDAVRWVDSRFMIEPPGERVRYFFHPISKRVERVELLDDRGRVLLQSILDKPERMEKTEAAIGPYMNTFITIITPGQEGNMKLWLSGMTDESRKVNQKVFDLEVLKEKLQPEVVIPVMAE